MRLTVIVFLIAVVLGVAVINVKHLTIVWRVLFDNWMGIQPRWLAWLMFGIGIVAAIIGLVLEGHLPK